MLLLLRRPEHSGGEKGGRVVIVQAVRGDKSCGSKWQVVVTMEYASHKFLSQGRSVAGEDEGDWDVNIGSKVKAIVLLCLMMRVSGVWGPLTLILHASMPVCQL
eukprot:scaffold135613_cov31-Tisochrysis_lutea.AAC.1